MKTRKYCNATNDNVIYSYQWNSQQRSIYFIIVMWANVIVLGVQLSI